MTHSTTREPSLSLPRSVPPPSAPELATDTPPAELYESSLRRRLVLVAALTGQATDGARAPLARREAARLAASTLGAAQALLSAWLDELRFEGVDLCDWSAQAAVDLGDELARAHAALSAAVAQLPAVAPRLARTELPLSPARRAGGAP